MGIPITANPDDVACLIAQATASIPENLIDVPPEVRNLLLGALDDCIHIGGFVPDTTSGTPKLVARFEFSERFAKALAALNAVQVQ